MRLTARKTAHAVAEGRAGSERIGQGPPESVHVEIAPPTSLDAWHRDAVGHSMSGGRAVDDASVDPAHDLGPARGMMTAVGLGVALWMAIIVVLRGFIA